MLHKSLGFIDKYVESRDRLLLMRVARYAGFVGRAAPPAARAAAVDAYVAADGGRRAALHALAAQVDAARRAQVRCVWGGAGCARAVGRARQRGARARVRPRRPTPRSRGRARSPLPSPPLCTLSRRLLPRMT